MTWKFVEICHAVYLLTILPLFSTKNQNFLTFGVKNRTFSDDNNIEFKINNLIYN